MNCRGSQEQLYNVLMKTALLVYKYLLVHLYFLLSLHLLEMLTYVTQKDRFDACKTPQKRFITLLDVEYTF